MILCLDYEYNRKLLKFIPSEKLFTYSTHDSSADVFISFVKREGNLMVFSAQFKNGEKFSFRSPLFGNQNLMNLGALVSFLYCEGFELPAGCNLKGHINLKYQDIVRLIPF